MVEKINVLTKKQVDLTENFPQLHQNAKKNSSSRKVGDYFKRRLITLQGFFAYEESKDYFFLKKKIVRI